jgi:hypothetical protein
MREVKNSFRILTTIELNVNVEMMASIPSKCYIHIGTS